MTDAQGKNQRYLSMIVLSIDGSSECIRTVEVGNARDQFRSFGIYSSSLPVGVVGGTIIHTSVG